MVKVRCEMCGVSWRGDKVCGCPRSVEFGGMVVLRLR